MSKQLKIIILGLFLVQIVVYTMIHLSNKTSNIPPPKPIVESALLTKYPDYETREIVYLNDLELNEMPAEIFLFKNLKHLHFENNSLQDFPYEVLELKHLEHLFLKGNDISKINLKEFTNASSSLKIIGLAENQITDFNGLEFLPELTHLDLFNNGITEIDIPNQNLIRLNLSSNNLRIIPDLAMTKCDFIGLSDNRIQRVNFEHIPETAMTIKLQNNDINELFGLDELNNLVIQELNLSQNALPVFPNKILNINNLRTLDLSNNLISSWSSEDLSVNESIVKIDLSANELIVLLADLNTVLPNLQMLSLEQNKLIVITFDHEKLYTLDIQNNPDAMCEINLPNLNMLNCDLQHMELELQKIIAPNLKELNIMTVDGDALTKNIDSQYPKAMIVYN